MVVRKEFFTVLIAGLLLAPLAPVSAQQKPQQPPKPPAKSDEPPVEEPPEEDESLKPREYSFNPLEAQKDVRAGDFYFKKGNFKAAARRFEEATKYDPGYADAYLRLGESREKLHDKKGAKLAYDKYLELKPDAKGAGALKRRAGS